MSEYILEFNGSSGWQKSVLHSDHDCYSLEELISAINQYNGQLGAEDYRIRKVPETEEEVLE